MMVRVRWPSAFALALCLGIGAATADAADDINALKTEISARWHVTVIDQDLAKRVVPLVTRPDRPVTMQDITSPNEPACLRAVVSAFEVYPTTLISSLVKKIALADMIYAWNIRGGGFHAPGLIAINCENAQGHEAFEADTIHQELAALLLSRIPLDEVTWLTFNPPGFHYGDMTSYRAELRDPHDRGGDEILHRNGFVTQLGLTDIRNDFETFAQRIFGHPQGFAALLRQYPAMRGKARMVMALYRQAAPALKDQFAASGLTQAAQ